MSDDIPYYREHAAKARLAAEAANISNVAEAHLKLVIMYENLVDRLLEAQGAQDVQPP
jgi:hypothetical protein